MIHNIHIKPGTHTVPLQVEEYRQKMKRGELFFWIILGIFLIASGVILSMIVKLHNEGMIVRNRNYFCYVAAQEKECNLYQARVNNGK